MKQVARTGANTGGRVTRIMTFLAALLIATSAGALGVGDITVSSKLNEPLDARVELLYSDPAEITNLRVDLASFQDFERVGLDRSLISVPLTVEILQNDEGRSYVAISSVDAVPDPFLSLLLELDWPNGRMLREYTILLDPPIYTPSTETVTTAPESRPRTAQPEPMPADESEDTRRQPSVTTSPATRTGADDQASATQSETEPVRTSEQDMTAVGSYGPTVRGDSLWKIASANKPSSVTMNQMMVAMLRINPNAFFEDNINALKRGAILRIPEERQIQALSVARAFEEVKTQNNLWETYRRQSAASAPTVTDQSSSGSDLFGTPRSTRDSDRLELTPPANDDRASAADRPGSGDSAQLRARISALQDDLNRAQEQRVNLEQENADLRDQVAELEALVQSYERTLELRQSELAQIQATMAQMQDDGATDVSGDFVNSQSDDEAQSVDTMDRMSEQDEAASSDTDNDARTAQSTSSETTESVEQEQPEPVVQQPRPSRPPQKGIMDYLMNPLVWGGLLLLIVIVGALLWFRSRQAGAGESTGGGSLAERMRARHGSAEDDADDLDDFMDLGDDEDADEAEQLGGVTVDELRQKVAENPDDIQAHLALMRRLYADKDADAFALEAEKMFSKIGDPVNPSWREVRGMGMQLVPNSPLFGGQQDSADSDDLDLDDLFADEGERRDSESSVDSDLDNTAERPAISEESDDDLDLDFGDLDSAEDMQSTDSAGEDDADDDLSLDFDLDDTEETVERAAMTPADNASTEPASDSDSDDDDLDDLGFDLDEVVEEEPQGTTEDSDDELDLDLDLDLEADSSDGDADDDLDFSLEFDADEDITAVRPSAEPDEAETQQRAAFDPDNEEELSLDLDLGDDAELTLDLDADEGDDSDTDSDSSPEDILRDIEDEMDLPEGEDVVETKLDLARAYIDMGDPEGAKSMLEEVVSEGNDRQQDEAKTLLGDLEEGS